MLAAPRNAPARQSDSKSTFFLKRPKFRKQKAEINKSNAKTLTNLNTEKPDH